MIIVMKKNATEAQIDHVIKWIESIGYQVHPSRGVERTRETPPGMAWNRRRRSAFDLVAACLVWVCQ